MIDPDPQEILYFDKCPHCLASRCIRQIYRGTVEFVGPLCRDRKACAEEMAAAMPSSQRNRMA